MGGERLEPIDRIETNPYVIRVSLDGLNIPERTRAAIPLVAHGASPRRNSERSFRRSLAQFHRSVSVQTTGTKARKLQRLFLRIRVCFSQNSGVPRLVVPR
jgi:hypothetical protein